MSDEGLTDIMQQVEQTIAMGKSNWLCELSDLAYCNSTGLNLFIRILTKARNAGGDCALINPQTGVQKLFELSKLNQIFTNYASLDEALDSYNTVS